LIIETWFPLAVATCDLAPTAAVTAGMLAALAPSIAAAAVQRRLGSAWTGDVNGCSDLHRREPFAWLRREVEREALEFVVALGGDASRLRLHFQGSWPVLSQSEESVSSHTHMTASLSAVYYLKVPDGVGGTLVFENLSSPNALGPDFGQSGTAVTRESNPLNVREACYQPREGRLVLFPARQPHAVRPHGAHDLRVSITFDIAVVPRDAKARPDHAQPDHPSDVFGD
jgi:uncharacterized protein (TIGR02466 family)